MYRRYRSTRAKSSSLTFGLRGVALAESSPLSLKDYRNRGCTPESGFIRSMWMNRRRSLRRSASVLCAVIPPFWGDRGVDSLQMPTFIIFKNGEKVGELVGANPQGLQVRTLIVDVHLRVTDKPHRNW